MKPLVISSGEPGGIGPDLCLALSDHDLPVVIMGDWYVLEERARQLQKKICFYEYRSQETIKTAPGHLTVFPIDCSTPVHAGQLNSQNAPYVLSMLSTAAELCFRHEFSALVTAPVHKANINAAGINFTGHTEFLAELFQVEVVMMLASERMKVALVTTHLPLKEVPYALTEELIIKVIAQVNKSLQEDFGIAKPRIKVAGLNPHAGESGYLGREEIDIITPALLSLKNKGLCLEGPLSADTLFTLKEKESDAYVVMYHDQGLPVLKYASFGHAVNITLGLPIIRTSVDHGTALPLAGKNIADSGSLHAAVKMALNMACRRGQ